MKKAVVLLSSGIDSTVGLYWMLSKGYDCYPLTVSYDQLDYNEPARAKDIVEASSCTNDLEVITLDTTQVIRTALTDGAIKEYDRSIDEIDAQRVKPSTYFPARNLIFLSLALGYAETIRSSDIFIGCYPGTSPDCGRKVMNLFEDLAQKSTEAGRRGTRFKIRMFKKLRKPDIILLGKKLGVPFELTGTCFNPYNNVPCGRCDACISRSASFEEAGLSDPLIEKRKTSKD